MPPEPSQGPRERPKTYSDRLVMKALIIMLIRRLYLAFAVFTFPERDDAVLPALRVAVIRGP
jgi:hypothetical protein